MYKFWLFFLVFSFYFDSLIVSPLFNINQSYFCYNTLPVFPWWSSISHMLFFSFPYIFTIISSFVLCMCPHAELSFFNKFTGIWIPVFSAFLLSGYFLLGTPLTHLCTALVLLFESWYFTLHTSRKLKMWLRSLDGVEDCQFSYSAIFSC